MTNRLRHPFGAFPGGLIGFLLTMIGIVLPGVCFAACTGCHTTQSVGKIRHKPIADGACFSCHQLKSGTEHPRDTRSLTLKQMEPELCVSCHKDVRTSGQMVHKPLESGNCTTCHDPHSSSEKALLRRDLKQLCLSCHSEGFSWKVPHTPVDQGACTSCHEPHSATSGHLLKAFGSTLCYRCHEQSLADGVSVHAPVESGDCQSCHQVHGANRRKLLVHDFPEGFYQSFSLEAYQLCFDCHRSELVTEEITATMTDFRNGDENLHYRHLLLPGRGRSCTVCHDLHASPQEHLIRSSVPGFGSWAIPISFTTTPDGGTCVVGCHKPKSYDRLHFITNP